MKVIYEQGNYRIVELPDDFVDLDDLKGDCFNPEHNPSIAPEKLRQEEIDFEQHVNNHGVFGYVLEVWNPERGQGWVQIDSCWSFIGQYSPRENSVFNHYIVDELKGQIK